MSSTSGTGTDREKKKGESMAVPVDGDRPVKDEDDDSLDLSSADGDGDSDEGPRVDVELIDLVSDNEDSNVGDVGGRAAVSSNELNRALRPIRLDAKAHVDRGRAIEVDTDWADPSRRKSRTTDEEAGGDDLFVPRDFELEKGRRRLRRSPEVEYLRGRRKFKGAYPEEAGEPSVQSMTCPNSWCDIQHADFPLVVKHELPDEAHAGTIIAGHGSEPVNQTATAPVAPTDPLKKEDVKGNAKAKFAPPVRMPKPPVLETQEDRLEWARHEQDVNFLGMELGKAGPAPDDAAVVVQRDEEGDVSMVSGD